MLARDMFAQKFWDYNATFTHQCQKSKLFNKTWGDTVRAYVDKFDTKLWVQSKTHAMKIVPTIALYDPSNISSFIPEVFLNMSRSNNLIIKPTHAWAVTARVWNLTYSCFRHCYFEANTNIGLTATLRRAYSVATKNMIHALEKLPSNGYLDEQPQYLHLPKRIIIEEHLNPNVQEYHWWIVHGVPVFVCARCDDHSNGLIRGSYFTSDFRKLNIESVLEPCPLEPNNIPEKPRMWDQMLQSVLELGFHVPGILSVDLFANDTDVFFSELTFTRNVCKEMFRPWVADALLNFMDQHHTPTDITASDVYNIIENRDWILIEWDWHSTWQVTNAPSPVDLCLKATKKYANFPSDCWNIFLQQPFLLSQMADGSHCFVKFDATSSFHKDPQYIFLPSRPSISATSSRLDWPWACGIVCFLLILETRLIQLPSILPTWSYSIVYLIGAGIYKSNQSEKFVAWWDHSSTLLETIRQSVDAFVLVHPVSSVTVCLSHFFTYWVSVAAVYNTRRLSRMLLWWLVYEVLTAFVNEWCHAHTEVNEAIHCTRLAFIGHSKGYVWNDVIRAYLLPPFLVYGYLLPKFIFHYFVSW